MPVDLVGFFLLKLQYKNFFFEKITTFFFAGYLGDILEDLGHPLTENLSSLSRLLKLPAKDFNSTTTSQEPQKLVTQIKTMRNLKW